LKLIPKAQSDLWQDWHLQIVIKRHDSLHRPHLLAY